MIACVIFVELLAFCSCLSVSFVVVMCDLKLREESYINQYLVCLSYQCRDKLVERD